MDYTIPAEPRIRRKAEHPRPMQFAIIPLRAITDDRLTDRQVRILGLIGSWCNRAGITWVTQQRLADEIGITRQAISAHSRNLAALGYLEKLGGYKRAVKGWTYRILHDPKITADDAAAISQPTESDMADSWTHNGPVPIGAMTGPIKRRMERKRSQQSADTAQLPKVAEEAGAYVREWLGLSRAICRFECHASERDREMAQRLADAGVPLADWTALLTHSLEWHRDSGRMPPPSLGYWLQPALRAVQSASVP
jgi:hypothetical protein